MNRNLLRLLSIILIPLSIIVRFIYRVRRHLYLTGYFKSFSFGLRTISIGNVVLGGSGKTPLMKWIINHLGCDNKLLISSRGYKSNFEKIGKLVHSSETASAVEIGDENAELLQELKLGSIAVGRNRVDLIMNATRNDSYKYLLIDDGFQHLKIQRDLNIVLFNSMMNFEDLKIFPMGYLREGLGSLFEADIVIFTNCQDVINKNEQNILDAISPHLNDTAEILRSKTVIKNIVNLRSNEKLMVEDLDRVILVSGIANPEKFKKLVENQKLMVLDHLYFPDHHSFKDKDYVKINKIAKKLNSSVLMTNKDAVKFDKNKMEVDFYYCDIELSFFGAEKRLIEILKGEKL